MENALKPTLQPFLDQSTQLQEADYAVVGAPFDLTSSHRSGSRFAPEAIRVASRYMETYSARTGLDLDNVSITDLGNVEPTGEVKDYLRLVEEVIRSLRGKVPVLVGGEHSVTLGALRALRPDLVLDFDAHLDLRDSLMGLKMSHATYMRRAMEELDFRLIILGVRALSREELKFVKDNGDRVLMITANEVLKGSYAQDSVSNWLKPASSVYVSIDADVLDPSQAPAVGNPSPEGLGVNDLLDLLGSSIDSRCVGFDLTEVSPHYDSGTTVSQAAYIILETIYLIERGRRTD
ncbi:MAG TPA: agmatinase [Patescibacteria group bacterium]|nr:agmatinase [Patescibacteria group bacterium]